MHNKELHNLYYLHGAENRSENSACVQQALIHHLRKYIKCLPEELHLLESTCEVQKMQNCFHSKLECNRYLVRVVKTKS
jgi:hypothetical protein